MSVAELHILGLTRFVARAPLAGAEPPPHETRQPVPALLLGYRPQQAVFLRLYQNLTRKKSHVFFLLPLLDNAPCQGRPERLSGTDATENYLYHSVINYCHTATLMG